MRSTKASALSSVQQPDRGQEEIYWFGAWRWREVGRWFRVGGDGSIGTRLGEGGGEEAIQLGRLHLITQKGLQPVKGLQLLKRAIQINLLEVRALYHSFRGL